MCDGCRVHRYDFREASLREAALLLIRTLVITFPAICTDSIECEVGLFHNCCSDIYNIYVCDYMWLQAANDGAI
jgi:hypothetical protein